MKKLIFNFSVILFFAMISLSFVSPQQNVTTQSQAELCINQSNEIINNLIDENFSYQRVNDSLRNAKDLYSAQIVALQNHKSADFSMILSYCDQIIKINQLAFDSRDQYLSLQKFYNVSVIVGMNTSEIDLTMDDIKEEMSSERYEEVQSLVDKTYSQISDSRASYNALNVFYAATTKGLADFFKKNWIPISVTIFSLIVLFILFNKPIRRKIFKNKLNKLELRRKTIQNLIKESQMAYFQHGKMGEGVYNIRTKKFAELIRDIDREIPLLKERIAMLERVRIK